MQERFLEEMDLVAANKTYSDWCHYDEMASMQPAEIFARYQKNEKIADAALIEQREKNCNVPGGELMYHDFGSSHEDEKVLPPFLG